GSVAMNFDTPLGNSENGIAQSNKQAVNEKGEKIYLDSQGNETTEAKTSGQANQAKLATGLASLTGGVNIGYGSNGDSQHSRTKSGINTANIDIRDSQAQQTKTGKTVEEIRAQVKTEIHTDNAESHSGKLENRFDKAAVQNELDTQIKATSEFQSITLAEIERQANNKAEVLKQEAKEAKAKGNRQEAERLQTEASKWEKGGSYRQALSAVTNGIGLALGGAPTEGVVAGTLSPYINTEIKKATEGNDTANILAHGVWGAMEAASQGGSALGGAAAAMTGEVGAKLLAEQLYGQSNPEHLSTEQKQTLSELSQVLAGATAGTVSGTTGGNGLTAVQAVATGMGVAKSAVENNLLSLEDDEYVYQKNKEFEEKGYLAEKDKLGTKERLLKDVYINHLIQKYQKDPKSLNYTERNYLNVELSQIARSYGISVESLYNWDFANTIKRDDSALSKYLIADDQFWNQSYEGRQAKSFAVGMATLPLVYGGDKLVRFYPELAKGVAANPVLSETAVVVGYKSGKLVGEGKVFVDSNFNQAGVEDIAKDGLKTLVLGKLPFRQQIGYGMAIDYGYEVNKHNVTTQSVTTEMIGSGTGSVVSGIIEIGTHYLPQFKGTSKIFGNAIFGDIASDKSKEVYKKFEKTNQSKDGNK
ncbi:VENN motif pre-toxin domain-containing protein, partial [Glaesserella parasuis]|nr:VENN motif pre-toxin domain-containing protein [Glaesserella parasuis]